MPRGQGEGLSREAVLALLRERESEIVRLSSRVRELEQSEERVLYEKASRLGVAAAVAQSGLPERQQRRLAAAIVREATASGLDPLLVVALIRCESSFDLQARSPVGAIGLMQVMPETGKWVASRRGIRLAKKTHLFDSELNLEIGSAYLASLLRRFGNLETALLAYNAGPSAARKILADRSSRGRFLSGYPKRVAQEFRKLKNANGPRELRVGKGATRARNSG
jgi:soluble lytic murein transglycosylase